MEKHNNTPKENKTAEQPAVGYIDLSKANNTKIIVLGSLVCVLLILLLSILFPTPKEENSSTTEITTEATTESIGETDPVTGFTTIENKTYLFTNDTQSDTYSGWYRSGDTAYYFGEDGAMVTGWQTLNGHQYFFNDNGTTEESTWVDDKYIGENGFALEDTITPDGSYVDYTGTKNNTVSLASSKVGLTNLKHQLEELTTSYSGTWSVYVKDLVTNEYLVINNVQHFSASLIKLFCGAAAFDLVEQGQVEQNESFDRLMYEMISVSDNDAFNLMVMRCAPNNSHIAGRELIQNYIDKNGYRDTTITSILVPTKYKAPSSPGRNYTTVVDCGLLLENIYKGQCVNPKVSSAYLDLLLKQTHTNKIPAGLPEGTKYANKTGDTDDVQHDAAIVYSPTGTYILCVMSSNCGAAIPNIQNISQTVYTYFNP